jgi:cytochrome c oxidase subunit 2
MNGTWKFLSMSTLAVGLLACSREPGEVSRPANAPETAVAEAPARSAVATPPQAAAVDAPTGAPEAPLQETAQAYMARHAERGAFAPGEIEQHAVGAIAVCAVCHGPAGEGNRALGAPRIGGMPPWYLARQLNYFKQGVRAPTDADAHGTQMRAVVLMLENPRVIEDLAAYLGTLSPPPGQPKTEGDVAHGAQLYGICMACHGADARGNVELNTPSLVDQDGEYLVRQLENFRTGVRGSHPSDVFGQQMRPIVAASLMSPGDAVDVVAYIATLRNGASSPTADAGEEERAERPAR